MRYETGVEIGRGASAEVFKARDPETGRTVALKLFPPEASGATPEARARREREARAQASLDHPSICEIYEVGTTAGGRDFIAMRHVDGEPLDRVCARLPIRRRLELVLQVVEAVGVAHEAGLVHRDLKPNNLLVEEQADGSLRAFVLDFGIVRVAAETRLTETGEVLGTAGYLSPEQARGAPIDARSDVFSLGVVLYQVLTGRMPFEASGVGAILQVLEHEPPLAHVVAPNVAPELAHIVGKAMEKDPRRRYPNAAALRRDLERYLGGTATAARGVGWLGRWVRRVERHPTPWLVGVLLVVLSFASLGWGVTNRLVVERQTRDAEIFARRASEIEARARYSRLLPRHSIEPARRALLEEAEELATDVACAEGRAAAAGHYALGRAELALGRTDRAVASLERARAAGFDEPAWVLDWTRALLEETRGRLREVELQRDPEARRIAKERLRDRLRERLPPGLGGDDLAELERGEQRLIRALDALVDERFAEARREAERLVEIEPWRIEADLIVADTWREEASAGFLGEDSSATPRALDSEKERLEAALLRAPSAPELYRRLCENRLAAARAELAVGRPVEEWEASFAAAEEACDGAVSVLASDLEAHSSKLELGWRRALARLSRRGDADEWLGEIRRIAEEARALLDHPDAGYREFQNLGNALFAEGQALRDLGRPSPEVFEEAARVLARGLEKEPGSAFGWQSLGMAWSRHGLALDARGEDPRASYRRSVDALRRSLDGIPTRESHVWSSICTTWNEVAYYGLRHADEVEESEIESAFEAAESACEEALRRQPDYVTALSNLALVHWTRFEWLVARGEDPTPAFEAARTTFAELFARAPEHASGRTNFAGLTAGMARWRLDRAREGEELDDLVAELREARRLVAPLLERFPPDTSIQLSRLRTLEAAALCAGDDPAADLDPEEAFAKAEIALRRLETLDSWQSVHDLLRAQFHARRAECFRRLGRADLEADLEAGLAAVERSLEVDPSSAEAVATRERLETLRGAGRPSS